MTDKPELRGKKVTVVGLGIEGVDLARYLVFQGADVTVSDVRTADRLAPRLRELDGLPVRLALGANDPADTVAADIVFVSQGVPLRIPALAAAREKGVPLSSMTRLFLELCPGPVIGVTGSSGKTTVTSLAGAILAAAGKRHVVGGNIGVGLLALLDEITPDTLVVLEMSHTQLELAGKSPHIACVLNVTPNHLDQYSWPEYLALKENILRYQTGDDVAVMNHDDEQSRLMASKARGKVVRFGLRGGFEGDGAFTRDGQVVRRAGGREERVMAVGDIPLRGEHNVSNVLAATAVASEAGVDARDIAKAVRDFKAVPHRLEFVAEIDGVRYYNDSIATTPERTLAGMRSFKEPLVLLLGGREKHLPLEEMMREMRRRCRAAVFFGEARETLVAAARAAGEVVAPEKALHMESVASLEEAVAAARAAAKAGDVVLLSPASTSFDAYDNFEERGEHFRRLVLELARQGGQQP
ncbi:MAG: UDP-N-acetylmuramoyl-L-alanine--D-glutamate ligase [Dehalococcoidia bacterium]|nr:UDP-N-acetylmuramoyl-L-alanine--D-glutamate ligase [Dehalococcoidia bacterium]